MIDKYTLADELFNSSPEFSTGFEEILSTHPYLVLHDIMDQYAERLAVIREFQRTTISIFREELSLKKKGEVLHWLMNETPHSLGIRYHKSLGDAHFTSPVFFRTDEVVMGRIAEIQCPGSLWGELQLTFNLAKAEGYLKDESSPAEKFVKQLSDYLGEPPVIHHLLDNSSAPAGMRYFIECTRPALKYWGIDKGIRPKNCNFIRSHSFFGLCAENDFRLRLPVAGEKIHYDLPPHILFDQKATLVLPFWSLTRDYFSDAIRNILLYSTPLLPSGIELPDLTKVSVEEFSRLPRSKRDYYLKYAGSDVSINWGAKAVFRLTKLGSEPCRKLLENCLSQFSKGKIWLLQKEDKQDDEIEYSDRDGRIFKKRTRAKFSAFYGPKAFIGALAMHRQSNKVHGQEDTVLSYVMNKNT